MSNFLPFVLALSKKTRGPIGRRSTGKIDVMDESLLLSIVLALALGSVMMLVNRAGYILLLLMPASQMFGLFNVNWAMALILLVIIAGVVISLSRLPELKGALFVGPMLVFIGLWIYGVLYHVYQNYSILFYSLRESVEFMTLFVFFGVFLVLRTRSHVEQAWRFIFLVALFYSSFEIAALAFGGRLREYFNYPMFHESEYFWHVILPFWPLILIAFMVAFFELALGVSRPMLRLWLLGIGLLLTFFRSNLLASMVAIPTVLLLSGQGILRTAGKGMLLAGLLGAALLGVVMLLGGGERFEKISDDFVTSGVTEVMTDTGSSLGARAQYAEGRQKIFEESPYLGYGFIAKESDLGQMFRARITYGDSLGFVDKGDLDLNLKFGYVGTAIIVLTVLFMAIRLIRLSRGDWPPMFMARCLSLVVVLLVFLIVQPVHAPLTNSLGLLPLGMALGLLEREYYLLCVEQAEEAEEIEEVEEEERAWSP